jgi:3-oxoacyl-[acyl-carrier protein] reductase
LPNKPLITANIFDMPSYDNIQIGDTAEIRHTITKADIDKFVALTGDDNRLHIDADYAAQTTFKKPVAHGMLSASFISTIIGTKIPGDGALWYNQTLEFLLPVRVGDEITVVAKVLKKVDATQSIELSTDVFNQNRQKVIAGISKVKVVPQESPEKDAPSVDNAPVKNALVIGATGGIGKAVAEKLAQEGYDIVLHYNSNAQSANELKNKLAQMGVKVSIIKADLLRERDINELAEAVKRKFGQLSILVNAATVALPNIKFEDLLWDDIQKHLDINIKSNFLLIKALLPLMAQQKYGKIVMLTTQAIEQPNAEWLHYITAKSALNGFSKALAIELARHGVRLNMVSPGMTDTELIANIPQKMRLLNAAKTPLRRIASVADVANAIWYLASPDSDFLTGETIRVNGGQVMI